MPRYYVTTPIYYVNGAPHLGHAYTSIAADVLARFHRLDGDAVFFLTGTDEHGQKVERAAEQSGMTPIAYADQVSARFRAMGVALGLSNDDFIRTTEPRHLDACAALWRRLQDAGALYQGGYEGWYALRDEAFYTVDETFLADDGTRLVRETNAPVEWVREPSWFFRLSDYTDRLIALFEAQPDFVGPPARRNELLSFLRGGLTDLSVSRTSFTWGVKVPGDPSHVMYVWVDALANYLTATGFPDPDAPRAGFWPADLHLVGKEIARFHAIYWPALLMAAGLPLPRRIYSHGWWTVEGEKMSKSLGNGLDPIALVDSHGRDPLRYFVLREVPFGADGDFRDEAVIHRRDRELANDLGNLAQRVLSLVALGGGSRPVAGTMAADDVVLAGLAAALPGQVREAMHRQALGEALELVWKLVREGNAYIVRMAPWTLRKTDPARGATVLRVLLDTLRVIGTLLLAFMPDSMHRLLDQLGVDPDSRTIAALAEPLPDRVLPPPQVLFAKTAPLAAPAAAAAAAAAASAA